MSELTSNVDISEIITNVSETDIVAADSIPNIVGEQINQIDPNTDLLEKEIIAEPLSTEMTALEIIKETLSSIADRALIAFKAPNEEDTAMLVGGYQFASSKFKNKEELIKVVTYNRHLLDNPEFIEYISLQVLANKLDENLVFDNIVLEPTKVQRDSFSFVEDVEEQLTKVFTKAIDDKARLLELIDFRGDGLRGAHNAARQLEKVSIQPKLFKSNLINRSDNILVKIYKHIDEHLHAVDTFDSHLGNLCSPKDLKQFQDSLEIYLQDYFAEDYVEVGYVGTKYSYKG